MARKKSRTKIGKTGCLFWLFILLIIVVVFIYKGKGNLKETFDFIKNALKPKHELVQIEKKEPPPPVETEHKEELKTVEKTETSQKPAFPSVKSREEEKKSLPLKEGSEQEGTLPAPSGTIRKEQPEIKQKSTSETKDKTRLKERQATLYFVSISSKDGIAKPAPVNRKIEYLDSPITRTFNTLLLGPLEVERKKGLVSFIPEGTKLLSAHIEKGHLTLNFSSEFEENYSGRDAILLEISQVILTGFDFKEVNSITILIDGKKKKYITGEGIPLKEVYTKQDLSTLHIGG